MSDDLPLIDRHDIVIQATRSVVFAAIRRHVGTGLQLDTQSPLAAVLGTEPRSGFAIVDDVPDERLVLAGSHRFSRYRLTFELTGESAGPTHLVAISHGEFPGVAGRLYRAAVIGSRGHVVVMKRMLRSIERAAVSGAVDDHG